MAARVRKNKAGAKRRARKASSAKVGKVAKKARKKTARKKSASKRRTQVARRTKKKGRHSGKKKPTKKKVAKKKVTKKKVHRRPRKAAGRSLHIGLNSVSPEHYAGWSGDLYACEFDAHDMAAIAKSKGMRSTVLRTRAATRKSVLAELRKAAKALKSGDFFFLSYSGHGGQVPDTKQGDEPDRQDETWCLYDGELIDDELYHELGRFAKGVRMLVLSDSCHSGTVVREMVVESATPAGAARPRLMPPAVARRTYEANKAFYDRIQEDIAKATGRQTVVDPDAALAMVATRPHLGEVATRFKAALILISGCQDSQTSMDGDRNGAFTEELLNVWHKGAFKGDYKRFHAVIRSGMPRTQKPNLFTLGSAARFLTQQPFEVSR